jgi:hypothetical protein
VRHLRRDGGSAHVHHDAADVRGLPARGAPMTLVLLALLSLVLRVALVGLLVSLVVAR